MPGFAPLQDDVVLPAGGRIEGAFAEEAGTRVKALIPFEGETMLARAIRCARAATSGRIVVVGPAEAIDSEAAQLADLVAEEGESAPDNMMRGLERLSTPTEHILVMTTDQPFVTPESLLAWLRQADPGVEICVPMIRQETFLERFPGMPATFVKLRDGAWTTGGAFRLRSEAVPGMKAHMDAVFAQRKSKLGMARLLGLSFLLRFLTRQLSSEDVRRKVEELLQCTGQLVYDCDPVLAYDIDLHEEYRYARAQVPA
jgi:CTP:molybdopterin cytidylyltransferase MocA